MWPATKRSATADAGAGDRHPTSARGSAKQEADRPASRAKDAVTVLTYHGSKGLEWPLVVLTDLDAEPKGDAFGVQIASDVPIESDRLEAPLAGRWIRFWPWPLGKQAKDVSFDATAANSDEGKEAARAERAERARLLYVGATRARDYLVLAVKKVVTKKDERIETAWLDELVADGGGSAVAIPAGAVASLQRERRRPSRPGRRIPGGRGRRRDRAIGRLRKRADPAVRLSRASRSPQRRRARRRGEDRRGG